MKGFLANLYLRPSCYSCPAKSGKSGSDITIGDLWGAPMIIGEKDDDRGVSLVLVNKNTSRFIDSSSWGDKIDYQSVLRYNPAIEHSVEIPSKRDVFFKNKDVDLDRLVSILTKTSWWKRIMRRIKVKFIYCK